MGSILNQWERKGLQKPREVCEEIAALRQQEWSEMAAD